MTAEKVGGGYKIRSEETGKLWPKLYKSKKAVKKRLSQIIYFKGHK